MVFEFTDQQKMIQKMVREFAEKEIAPGVSERDEREEFSRVISDRIGELGLTGLCFPEAYGGSDGDYISYIIANEELAKVDDCVQAGYAASISLCAMPIFQFGTEEQKQRFLVPLAEGVKLGAFGLTEPNAGSDAASQLTTAVADGDYYVLNGNKIFITNGGEAETYVVFAMTDKTKGVKGITAFVLEKGMPGFTFGKTEHKMGIRSSQTQELIFQDVKVPKENMLGKEGEGFKIAMSALDGGRITVAAQALGIAQAALHQAIKYSKERVQFGKPISTNQAVAFMLADMATEIDAARLLTYRAAYLKQKGQSFSKEAAMAKLFASDAAMKITTDAVQIFGGYGFSREYPVERLMRNAKITQIYEGTNQVQRMVIAGAVLR